MRLTSPNTQNGIQRYSIKYEYGFNMHTGQKVTRKKEKFEEEKLIRIKPKQITSHHTRYED